MSEQQQRVLSVFELAQGLKRTVEDATVGLWVEGEVGRLTKAASGHAYFTLKDERRDAVVDCVMYRREAMRFGRYLEEGGRVQLRGRASFYPPRGRLQWIADSARPAGQGALLEALERLKKQLIAEGLTDTSRKRPLPDTPRVVGVVTSDRGAAFSDICTVARRRGNVRIVLAPSQVQGEEAPRSIVKALDAIERLPDLDVLVVGRGGGSQEDLMAFNDERVVRRIAACRVPVVSAVGHEVDTTLSDLVADVRAATPSQAAELVVPDESARREALARLERQLHRALREKTATGRAELETLRRRLGDPRIVLAEEQQSVDELSARLQRVMVGRLGRERTALASLSRRLSARHPTVVVARVRAEFNPLQQRLVTSQRELIARHRSHLAESARALSALSPLAILGRGYALATNASGGAIRQATDVSPGDEVSVRVDRGAFTARVEKILPSVENSSPLDHESVAAPIPGEQATRETTST